jgi:regulator of sirC expression with transglutaminase-like and TPR domain
MNNAKELKALFTLIDDPDEEVYTTVSEKIVGFGKAIIPNLENLWENTINESVQNRIEQLIHRLHFADLRTDFCDWRDGAYNDLLTGALLVAKYQYPDLQTIPVLQDLEKIKRNVWLELNSYLTPLEQANVLSSIIYNYYNLKGNEIDYQDKDDFFVHKVLARKKGNTITNGIIYQSICELLQINARVINIPMHFIIAFFQDDLSLTSSYVHPKNKIHFFVDGTTGQVYSHADIENYLKKMNATPLAAYYKPLSHKKIIQLLLEETSKCYELTSEHQMQKEILTLSKLLF